MKLLYGVDVLDGLKTLPDKSVHCCITSPPYWGLRNYGVDGQIGLEKTPEEYAAKMVAVFREVKRALRDDGTLWLNLGDSYAGSGKGGNPEDSEWSGFMGNKDRENAAVVNRSKDRSTDKWSYSKAYSGNGVKPKDLCGIPWMVAFALRADGWYLRQDIIWHKPNPMPESVTDRCTKSHEYVFLLSKSSKYYFDYEAIKEPLAISTIIRCNTDFITDNKTSKRKHFDKLTPSTNPNTAEASRQKLIDNGNRNKRSVWTVTTKGYAGAHFATFPQDLIIPMIQAGCPMGGVVLDPFSGSGTTGEVALGLGRDYIGIDLNKKYEKLARNRFGLFV